MGRPKADLASYSPWGAVPIPPPFPPLPIWLPVVPTAGVQTWADLAMWALRLPGVVGQVSLYTNEYQPVGSTTLADFDTPSAPGLQTQNLGIPIRGGINPGGRSIWTWPLNTFVAAGGGLPVQIWGYYVSCTDPWTGQPALLFAQKFINSFGFINPGDSLPVPLATSFGQC